MTQEEKAKAYDEALERARKLYEQGTITESLCYVFPELKESTNERIRKGLIKAVSRTFEGNKLFGTDVTREEALAWLEKQGEKKPQRMISAEAKEAMYDKPAWSEEDELKIKEIEEAYTNYCHGYTQDTILDWLKSIKQRIGG